MPETFDLGGVLSEATKYGDARAGAQEADDAEALAAVTAERDAAKADLAASQDILAGARAEIARLQAIIDGEPEQPNAADLVAVAVFPTYTTKTYGNHAAVLAKLDALGVKNVRHLLMPNMSPAVQKFTADAYALGISSWLTVGKPRVPFTAAEWGKVEALLKGPLRGMVSRVFGWNEPNHQRSPTDAPMTNWNTKTITECKALWAMVQRVNADYVGDDTPAIRVATPGLWSGDPAQQFDDLAMIADGLAGTYDDIAWHLYMRAKNGAFDVTLLEEQETAFRANLDDTSPIVCTEAGYFTASHYAGGSNVVTEAQQADLIPQLVDWYVSRGYGLCDFELLDDPDPSGTLREASFGLVRCPSINPATWTDKPAFAAVAGVLA